MSGCPIGLMSVFPSYMWIRLCSFRVIRVRFSGRLSRTSPLIWCTISSGPSRLPRIFCITRRCSLVLFFEWTYDVPVRLSGLVSLVSPIFSLHVYFDSFKPPIYLEFGVRKDTSQSRHFQPPLVDILVLILAEPQMGQIGILRSTIGRSSGIALSPIEC